MLFSHERIKAGLALSVLSVVIASSSADSSLPSTIQDYRAVFDRWADDVAGNGKGNRFILGASNLWLGLCPVLPKDLQRAFYEDIKSVWKGKSLSDLLAIARLARYAGSAQPSKKEAS